MAKSYVSEGWGRMCLLTNVYIVGRKIYFLNCFHTATKHTLELPTPWPLAVTDLTTSGVVTTTVGKAVYYFSYTQEIFSITL